MKTTNEQQARNMNNNNATASRPPAQSSGIHHPHPIRSCFPAVLLLLAVLAGCPSCKKQPPHSSTPPARPAVEVEPLIQAAEAAAQQAIRRRADEFETFVLDRRQNAPAYAKQLVSLKSKWLVVRDKLPFTDTDRHKKFVEAEFHAKVISSNELADALQRGAGGLAHDLESIENDLAVQLRQTLTGRSLPADEQHAARQHFQSALNQAASASRQDLAKSVGSLVVSELATSLGVKILTRLGVSAGILGTGAATSWQTLGAGLVIGLVVDQVWGWIDNTEEKITKNISAELESVAARGAESIRQEGTQALRTRAQLWRAVAAVQQP